MAEKHHYFFAVKLPKEVKIYLNKWVQMNEIEYPFARWVHPEDYHITLAFLGFADTEMLNHAIEQVKETLTHANAFNLTLNEFGTFGPEKFPRIFWADVNGSDDLKSLQKKVFNLCEQIGFKLDKKPFKPHITLARKWKADEPFNRDKLSQLHSKGGLDFTFTVNEVVLYETHLDKTPKYREYEIFPLKIE